MNDAAAGADSDRKMLARKRDRESYRCDCSGSLPIGRPNPSQSNGVRLVVLEWTGDAQSSCPWSALRDPFVRRVLDAYRWFESGQIATAVPSASHRLMEGIGYYERAVSICRSKAMELDREEARRSGNR